MLFRVLTIGLCAACVFLLATAPLVRVVVVPAAPAIAARSPALSVIDVAAEVAPASIPDLVRLGRDEWVKTVDDQRVEDVFEADDLIRTRARHGGYLDLTVGNGATERRVLLLVH